MSESGSLQTAMFADVITCETDMSRGGSTRVSKKMSSTVPKMKTLFNSAENMKKFATY